MAELSEVQLVSERFCSQVRLRRAIKKLWAKVVGQSHLSLESQMVGVNIMVGIRIFSIVADLSFESDLIRGCGLLPLKGLGPCWPRRPKMLVKEEGMLRSSLNLIVLFKGRGQGTMKLLLLLSR